MPLLVVGATGLLGSNVVTAARRRGHSVVGTYHSASPSFDIRLHQLDVRDRVGFDELLSEHEPEAVINCAAMTDVDGCETRTEQAHVVNGHAPGELAAACDDRDVEFVHVSTDYVFDGTTRAPYVEDAERNPVQVYGESKLAGERAVDEHHQSPLVLRLSFVYGTHGATGDLVGFPAWVRERLVDDEVTPLFTDQFVTPTRAGHAADSILDFLELHTSGTFHVASRSCVTPYEFGDAIRDRLGKPDSLVEEGSQEALDRPATRPVYTCLDVSRVETALGRPEPTLNDDLDTLDDVLV